MFQPIQRRIIHVDMDAFFASVEQLDAPELRGKPVVVGGSRDGRGVVAAASYEARKFGIHSAMPSRTAARLCPEAIFVKPRFDRYREISGQVMRIFEKYATAVEPLSLDEAYLDVTHSKVGPLYARDIAKLIKEDILQLTGLTASAGVAPNKFLAKIASDYRKPDGLTVIAPERIEVFLHNLPVRKFPGVGPSTEKRLHEAGLKTAKDLRTWKEEDLREKFGKFGGWLYRVCRGEDTREVNSSRERKSLGAEDTFETDIVGLQPLGLELDKIAQIVERRLQAKGLRGATVTLKVTFAGFTKITRRNTGGTRLDAAIEIARIAKDLLATTEAASGRPVRLLGIQIAGFDKEEPRQLELPFAHNAPRS